MRKAVFTLIIFFGIAILLETCLRLALCLSTGASFLHPSTLIYKYYPELIPIQKAEISNTDSTLDILILSCSVLHKDWVDIVSEMDKCMRLPAGYNHIKIYNASGVGHGSRDNLVKCGLLKDKKFDVVMYYDAINDSRLNNCPDGVFKADYSHYLWYDEINNIMAHPEMDITVIPFFYDWIKTRAKALFAKNAYIPIHFSMRPEWLMYGNKMKSLPVYKNNLDSIIDMLQPTKFVYFTFAYYLPANYTLQKFEDKTLDYSFCNHSRETEIWGVPANVSAFIDSVNLNSRQWVGVHNGATWVDLSAQFPKNGLYFADICHFSPQGIHEFAGIVCGQLDSVMLKPKQ